MLVILLTEEKIMTRSRIILLALLLALPLTGVAGDIAAEKRADIRQLLTMTGAMSIAKQMGLAVAAQTAEAVQKARPDIPASVFQAVSVEIEAVFDESRDALVDGFIVPLYDKHFTGAEIKEMIRFYGTPLGQKTIRVMPVLVSESMQLGQAWGQSLQPELERRVRTRLGREGYFL